MPQRRPGVARDKASLLTRHPATALVPLRRRVGRGRSHSCSVVATAAGALPPMALSAPNAIWASAGDSGRTSRQSRPSQRSIARSKRRRSALREGQEQRHASARLRRGSSAAAAVASSGLPVATRPGDHLESRSSTAPFRRVVTSTTSRRCGSPPPEKLAGSVASSVWSATRSPQAWHPTRTRVDRGAARAAMSARLKWFHTYPGHRVARTGDPVR